MQTRTILAVCFLVALSAACSSPRIATVDTDRDFERSPVRGDTLLAHLPDYSASLNTIRGKGKAIVSEPGNSERVTVYFSGNRGKSLVTIKNALGIEGGQLLSEGDSLLIYNKVDRTARKISVLDRNVTSIGHLASVNVLEMINFVPRQGRTLRVYESENRYLVVMKSGTKVYIDKNNYNVRRVDQPTSANLPYSRIIYEAYGTINGFKLPRRVTIFSADAESKVALLIQSLEINPGELDLDIDLPSDVKLVTQ
ncbi:DUF4292 domain-containing protein [Halalkalibaculum sp. DA3122]|uniref:DUF4292 domain-containing protein n=1 Tax=unclassified Halalkalibaculum TaxID=2964617 RepID=UPI003754012D